MKPRKSTPDPAAVPADRPDLFMANLRQALEHITDAEWLKIYSPLESASPFLANRPEMIAPAPKTTGIAPLDARLQAVYADWQSRPKTTFQHALWLAACLVEPGKDANYSALLLLTYFQDPKPKQAKIIQQLAISQSTYYRQLNNAVESLRVTLLNQIQPSLRLESPLPKPLIGRDVLLRSCLDALAGGSLASMIGASGIGKTSLGAAIATHWRKADPGRPRPVFWYTFRPGLTDTAQQLLFALALFMHQQQHSALWQHMLSDPGDVDAAKALGMLRKGFEALRSAPPLLVFNETDLLLADELDDSAAHAQTRHVLEALVESERSGAALLFIGQRLLVEPEPGRVFRPDRFDAAATRALLRATGHNVDEPTLQAIQAHTRGNPLLVQLAATLQTIGEPVFEQSARLSASFSLDWFLTRMRRRLSDKELDVLDAISVYNAPAPEDIWRKQRKVIDRLSELSLVDRDARQCLSIPAALRDGLYRRLPDDVRAGLHLAAAQSCAERGIFTQAAHHFVHGRKPEMAVWTWYAHHDAETRQGMAQAAARIFEHLRPAQFEDERDRRALALINAQLRSYSGAYDEGLEALDAERWPAERSSSIRARALRGRLLAMRGDVDGALAEYRAGLESLDAAEAPQPVNLRVELAEHLLHRSRDPYAAKNQTLRAKHDVELMLGRIDSDLGDLEGALDHLRMAAAASVESGDHVRLAKANEVMGLLEIRRLNIDAAVRYLGEASRHFEAYGNVVCAVGVTKTNISYAYLLARRYREAVQPAADAVAFFEPMRQPYWLALNEANLAEAYANLSELEQAEQYVLRAQRHEELAVQPYCHYVLGHIRRVQGRFDEAERQCHEAVASAKTARDRWAMGAAWRTLGEVYTDWGRTNPARDAFANAIETFTQIGFASEATHVQAMRERLAA